MRGRRWPFPHAAFQPALRSPGSCACNGTPKASVPTSNPPVRDRCHACRSRTSPLFIILTRCRSPGAYCRRCKTAGGKQEVGREVAPASLIAQTSVETMTISYHAPLPLRASFRICRLASRSPSATRRPAIAGDGPHPDGNHRHLRWPVPSAGRAGRSSSPSSATTTNSTSRAPVPRAPILPRNRNRLHARQRAIQCSPS